MTLANGQISDFTSKTLSAVIMASGCGHRFGENKLLYPIGGMPMVENLFCIMPADLFHKIIVVSKYDEILTMSEKYGYIPVRNDDLTDDIAKTISLGIHALDYSDDGCMFFTSDQPWLTAATIHRLASEFHNEPGKIHIPLCQGQSGNPVIFPRRFFADLRTLPSQQGGKYVVKQYPDAVSYLAVADPLELKDVDTKADLLSASV